jgi:hypothetical protein
VRRFCRTRMQVTRKSSPFYFALWADSESATETYIVASGCGIKSIKIKQFDSFDEHPPNHYDGNQYENEY